MALQKATAWEGRLSECLGTRSVQNVGYTFLDLRSLPFFIAGLETDNEK